MKLILKDEFDNEVSIDKPEAETWIDYSKAFVQALRILEFQIPESYDNYLEEEQSSLDKRIEELYEKSNKN